MFKAFRWDKLQNTAIGQRGSVLAWVVSIAALVSIVGVSLTGTAISLAKNTHKDWNSQVLNTAVRSSFRIVEVALERRLWEIPLGPDCMQLPEFSTTIRPSEGMEINIVTQKDTARKVLTMTATGTYEGIQSQFVKILKISDVSQFLLFSKGPASNRLSKPLTSTFGSVSLIAGAKRIYSEGKVIFETLVIKTAAAVSWGDSTVVDKEELGLILQGDRLLLTGGLSYNPYIVPFPDTSIPGNSEEFGMLNSHIVAHGTLSARFGGGHALIFEDEADARFLADNFDSANFAAIPSPSVYQKSIFPNAFFCGTPPLFSHAASDTGCFHSDVNKTFVLRYRGPSGISAYPDVTCMSKTGSPLCSDSEAFPKGFESWKTAAGLDSTLFTKDVEPIDFKDITWENMEALREEAQLCGLVISSPEPSSYEDCDLADQNFLNRRLVNGGTEACTVMSTTTIDTIVSRLNNFNAAAYSNPANAGRYGRRIVYSKVPLEVSQPNARGLWPTQSASLVRGNIPFWFVSEEHFRLSPHQFDTTSPLDADLARMRVARFNDGDPAAGAPLNPLKLTFLTPQPLEVVSPFHKPYTRLELNEMYPVVGGEVKPKLWALTDYVHQEEDAFKYGVREVILNNLALISRPGTSVSLRGLWAALENTSLNQTILNTCMMDVPNDGLGRESKAQVPLTHSHAPPLASKFYQQSPVLETNLYAVPNVFLQQYGAGVGLESSIFFRGPRVLVGFEDKMLAGKNLGNPSRSLFAPSRYYAGASETRAYYNNVQTNLTARRFIWDYNYNIQKTPESSPGVADPAGLPCGSPPLLEFPSLSVYEFYLYVNLGRALFSHQNSATSASNFGTIFAQPLLNVKSE